MILHRVRIAKNLLGDLYLAKVGKSLGTIVFLGGLPSYMHRSKFGESLAELGFNVLQPFYYGSWVSGGNFSAKNCRKTVLDCLRALESKKSVFDLYAKENLPLAVERIFLGGISFGTNVIQSLKTPNNVSKIFLVSAVPLFKKSYMEKIKLDGVKLADFMRRGFPNVYRTKDWRELEKEFSGNGKIFSNFRAKPSLITTYQGENDKISPQAIRECLGNENISIKIHEIKGAGHALNEFNEDLLANIVAKDLI
ncbi:hypothetical protein L6255_00220 [Candidatus Parcubacteria bacterium]|nr:hypothetical protein [Patescibacteria group bacterium]MBU4381371.1 hypothetical protein [Patescibacteria group bacterium]MCG2688865.1 hypothetical protein [Candidatus Parcubacteria bacterium]